MKNVIVLVMVSVFLLVAGCTDTTVSLWDERDGGLGGRIGVAIENTEVGASFLYWPDGENEDAEVFGAYGLYKFPDMVEIPLPIQADFLPETIMATPYFGGRIEIDGRNSQLIAGVEIANTLFMEYQDTYILIGLKHKF